MDEYFNVEIGVCRVVMQFFGIWPKGRNFAVYVRFIALLISMIGLSVIPQTVKLFKVKDNFDELLETITNCHLVITIGVVKNWIFWSNHKALGWLLDTMATDWKAAKTEMEQKIMRKNAKLSRLTTIMLLGLAGQSCLCFLAVNAYKLSKESESFKQGKFNATDRIRSLYLPSEFAFDVQQTPYYEITWVLQFFTTLVSAMTFMIIDGFTWTLVLHLCAQLKNLRWQFKNLLAEAIRDKDELRPLNLAQIVERHKFLLDVARTIEDVFNIQFLAQLLSSILIFCLNGYQIVLTITSDVIVLANIFYAVYYYFGFVFGLFVCCLIATVLNVESTKLSETAYNSEWYELSPADTRLLILIMIRTQRPFQLTAGKFVGLSLNLYCSVLKTSGGYVSMLLAMKNRLANS